MANGASIQLNGVSKAFGDRRVLDDISLTIAPGEFVAVVGKSGCGKSTLLRLVAGLETTTEGMLAVSAAPRLMFQDARLLPWKRVGENVALGSPSPAATASALAQVGLADRDRDFPAVLSGGQKQRVALARALASAPPLLLLDEPLGALDALTRAEMQTLLSDLWRERGFTALLVTHDIEEAVLLADRVILLDAGRIAYTALVTVPRPRRRGNAEIAALTDELLTRILAPQAVADFAPSFTI
ncbi:MAG: ATP-binding cassette domain-containing protein [Armatimonadetes bacterium]|nr:ATP-binding cassette domain-containing protein [Armatimonadota bacterium]